MKKYKLGFLTAQPIIDQAPLFKELAKCPDIDLTVYFSWDTGVHGAGLEEEFGVEIKWDIPLLEGYNYKFLKNFSPKPSASFWGQINPGIVPELFHNRYDALIVHGYGYVTDWFAYLGAFLSSTPVFFRGETVLRPNRPAWIRAIKWMILRPLFRRISAFLSMGSWSEKFYRYYGVPDRKVFFTPSAADNERFMRARENLRNKRETIRRKLGVDKNDIVILFVGKLISKKRPMDLLKAFELLTTHNSHLHQGSGGQAHSTTHLIFVGDGKLRGELEKYAKTVMRNNQHSLNSHKFADSHYGIHFAGFKNLTELPEYYSISDIFVLPSTSEEVSPLVINEAMCFGLPVIVSDAVPSAFDFVKRGRNGFIFPMGEIEALASHLRELADGAQKRKMFGEKSLEIIKGYSYRKDVEGVIEALRAASKKKI